MTKETHAPGSRAHDADRHSGKNAGPIRSRGTSRARGWVLALALIGIGGGLATVSMDAGAQGGLRDSADRAIEAIERFQDGSDDILDLVDATDEQRERIDAILSETVDGLFPLREALREHQRALIVELTSAEIDRAALEAIRTARLAAEEMVSARMLDSVVAIAEVLDAEQHQQLVERLSRR